MKKTNITPAQLQVFVTIVEAGSVTAASQVLNLTQSGVSHALASLEKSLGFALFHRERSGVCLTNAGEELLRSARALLAQVDNFEQCAALIAGETRGSLRIGCFPSAGSKLLPQLIRAFMDEYENINISIQQGTDADVIDWLATQVVDVGFVLMPNAQFDIYPIASDEFVALLPDTHPCAGTKPVSIADIADDPYIMSTGGCEHLINAIFTGAGYSPNIKHLAQDINTILAFVKAGLGVSIVPTLWLPDETIPAVPIASAAKRRIGLAVRAWQTASPIARQFIEFACEQSAIITQFRA